MKKISSILVAGLVALAFAGEALAQTQTPPRAPSSGTAVSAEKPAAKLGKQKAKRVKKQRTKRAAKRASAIKTQ